MKKSIFKRIICIITAIVAIAMPSILLSGCTFFDFDFGSSVEFLRGAIELEEGDTYELLDIIDSNVDKYTVTSSNTNVARVNGTRLTAVGVGRCKVTATAGRSKSTLNVRVTEKEPETVKVVPDGELFQSVESMSEVGFTVNITGVDFAPDIDWKVNGEHVEFLTPYERFSFTPTAAGEYVISATPRTSNLVDEAVVRVYYDVTATGAYDGETTQVSEPYTAIALTTEISENANNPQSYVEWLVDGELLYGGAPREVSYKPTVGQHTVTLKVNGKPREINGASYLTVTCAGKLSATELDVVYDNVYPHAYFVYDIDGDVAVEVTMPDGKVEVYSSDGDYAGLFDGNGFDVGSIIDVCATSSYRRTYKFRVKSLGDGGLLLEGDYSDYYKFMQLPSAAKRFLQKQYADRDYYITSDWEYANLLQYEIIARDKTVKKPHVDFDCYIAYSLDGSANDLWDNAFEMAATSGKYTEIEVDLRNGVMSTSFYVSTVNTPTAQTYGKSPDSAYSKQLHAVVPHINYDENKYRADDYVFPIDRRSATQSVTYSEELYFVAENNTRPLPVSGSAADTVYKMARDILRKIVTDDMTDIEKAHAIYDWIMWQVTYDSPATTKDKNGEAYSAYYLEGVFGDGKTSIGGTVFYPYAVCDGMSKAYSLMCNIEGIPCERVIGDAGDSMKDAGGHAWNKVFVDGKWYVVDCTWGDAHAQLTLGGSAKNTYELGIHEWLFVTDKQADETHFEPYELGTSNLIYAHETTSEKYSIYEHMTYNGTPIDCLVKRFDDQPERLEQIGKAFAEAYTPRTSIYVPGGTSDGVYALEYEAIEVYFETAISIEDSEVRKYLERGAHSVRPNADTTVFVYDNMAVLLIKVKA